MNKKSSKGIDFVRPAELKFKKINENNDSIQYEIETKKDSKSNNTENVFIKDIDTLIFCNKTLTIQVPKPNFMKQNNKSKFAYAFGMFPNPKNGKAAYLDGCILGALGLKRQKTLADVICFITHDITLKDKQKLEVVFDKVIYVPYISPYDMGGEGKLKTILMDPKIFQNCNNYTKNHPYSHVFFKIHIFNPDLFPYEKVCFVDSDLVPMNYYDSLFMLDTPAGWVEYRKKFPYKESFHWDRCDFLKHGEKIPNIFTDIDNPGGADVNAGLMVVSPNKKEYNAMIKELTSPIHQWMGENKIHKGFHDFDFNTPSGQKFVQNSYCYPEQNYLTKRYSGKWTYIEFAFQSWTLDPCNSFGIHMAAFNPKPWFKQPVGSKLNIKKSEITVPYLDIDDFEELDLPKAFISEKTNNYYENISYSYEIFNDLMVWGLIQYPELKNFFLENMEIRGPKISFDKDIFKSLTQNDTFILMKDINKNSEPYKKLSLSQKNINQLLNNYEKTKNRLKKKYKNICYKKKINRYGQKSFDPTIVTWPDYKNQYSLLFKAGKTKAKTKKKKQFNRKSKQTKQKKKSKQNRKVIYFYMKNCKYCVRFQKIWEKIKQNKKNKFIQFKKINGPENKLLKTKYKIKNYPSIILISNQKHIPFQGIYNYQNIQKFISDNI